LQKVWILRYLKGKSYYRIQSAIFSNETGGISYKTIKRWDSLWRIKKESLIHLLMYHLVDIHPTEIDFRQIKPLTDEQTLIYLLPKTWKFFHSTTPYPFYGFFNWINQLMNKI
ncbi:helix-turn-helix domain-containing protein, partial [Neobacillus sp. KR4-4]